MECGQDEATSFLKDELALQGAAVNLWMASRVGGTYRLRLQHLIGGFRGRPTHLPGELSGRVEQLVNAMQSITFDAYQTL
jgi:hypothetical protein